MKKDKKPAIWKPFLFLLFIPVQIGLDVLLFYGGLYLDGAMYEPSPDQMGHAVPIATGLAVVLGASLTIFVIGISLLLTIVFLVKQCKKRKKWKLEKENATISKEEEGYGLQ